ncbi:unnamed protein product [Musa hybrid cultivar]|uniref:Uncharacterized protein n=1 Tax=Musa acuminata subsp. malaccensis TaxID=214687 RepID=A0A804JUN5_MUSAM
MQWLDKENGYLFANDGSNGVERLKSNRCHHNCCGLKPKSTRCK